jgi:hypothetical protein
MKVSEFDVIPSSAKAGDRVGVKVIRIIGGRKEVGPATTGTFGTTGTKKFS